MNFADFPIGPFLFSTGGVIFTAGIIAATWMLTRTVHEKGLLLSFLNNNLIGFAIFSLIVGRIGALSKLWPYFERETETTSFLSEAWLYLKKFVLFWHGGIDVFWTGIAFLCSFLIFALWKKESAWKWLDAFVLPTILLLIFWNLGSFFSAWDYGKPVADGFWFGVTYSSQEVRYSVPLHPVQIYAFIYYSSLFFWGWRAWRKRRFPKDGVFFGVMVSLVFLGNTLLEFFHGDPATILTFWGFDVRLSQVVSITIAIAAGFFLIFHTHPEILHPHRDKHTSS